MIIDDKVKIKSMKGSWGSNYHKVIRSNPLRIFSHNIHSDKIKDCIVRKYCNNIDELKICIGRLPRLSILDFLMYSIKFYHIKSIFIELYKKFNTHEIAKILGLSQQTVRKLLGGRGLNITDRSMRCSKVHLRLKPIIESIIGYKTVTEKFIQGYWIDEFCSELNLCIEIDGKWCHNENYDKKRDEFLNSLGYSVIRIPSTINHNKLKELLVL